MKRQDAAPVVLMADDDEDDCHLVELAFRKIAIATDLRFVGNGKELLDYLYSRGDFADSGKCPKPNIILLDLNMPLMDGREALSRIKSDSQLRNIPILILSTSGEERDIVLSKQAGASSFLTKPESFEDFVDLLSKFCAAILHDPDVPFQAIGLKAAQL